MADSAPAPHELWAQANSEHPGDDDARRKRYFELMVEAGHLVLDRPAQEQYTADNPPPWINKHRYDGREGVRSE